ncbi:MAG: TolC family protein [Flavipsychrobacter sp.]|nr:TolC family protein [Flavipsychrobacter sp.]
MLRPKPLTGSNNSLFANWVMKNPFLAVTDTGTRFISRQGRLFFVFFLLLSISISPVHAQEDPQVASMTLDECIDYALVHQPYINQSLIGISIAKTTNAINLAGWLPQVSASANAIHYFQLPTSLIADSSGVRGAPIPTHTGVTNTVIPELSATETLFNPQLLYAAKAANLYVKEARQVTDSAKIFTVATVCKSFYNLLLTLAQINVLKEDTARLDRNVLDTHNQFIGGIVDETDYDEAVITLNTSKAQLKQQIENIAPQYAILKQAMGYPPKKQFNVVVDTAQMMQDIAFDTTQEMEFDHRIEYQQLQTAKKLQHELTGYYGLSFLPTVSAFYNYFYEYESNTSSGLFSTAYPYSYIGLSVNIPLFTGFSRIENIHKARLQERLLDWSQVSLKAQIYTEYTTALANYKSNLYSLQLLEDNEKRARNVYRIVSLQYKQGIVAYLNMIVAESNLISAEVGYTNALYQLLSSKIDLEKAMGDIPYNH